MRILLLVVSLIFSMTLTANAAIYQQGVVYIIYSEEGDAAVKDGTDLNSNGVPDAVEDIATQINATREVLKDVFKFPDPLNCERFKGVTSIEINIRDKEVMKAHGISYSTIREKSRHNPNEKALHINMANTINPHKNSTPAHEYFHLVQYSATYFKNVWFIEGMARWSQDVVKKINKYPDGKNIPALMKNKSAGEEIFQGKYEVANLLWYPLAVNMKDKDIIPDALMKKYKYVDGSPVFKDNVVYGANVMRNVMNLMKSREKMAAKNFGTEEEWREKGRRDERNNEIIFNCVREVYYSK